VHHIVYCCISVGVFKDGKPFEGAVFNPILDEFFYAKRGEGAFLNGQRIAVSDTTKLIDALLATGFPYTKVKKGKDYRFVIDSMASLLPKTRDIRRLGSAAIDLAYVACGRFDAFYEYSLNVWDVAAGAFIVERAGGKVSDFSKEKNYLYGREMVAANSFVYDEFADTIKDIFKPIVS